MLPDATIKDVIEEFEENTPRLGEAEDEVNSKADEVMWKKHQVDEIGDGIQEIDEHKTDLDKQEMNKNEMGELLWLTQIGPNVAQTRLLKQRKDLKEVWGAHSEVGLRFMQLDSMKS